MVEIHTLPILTADLQHYRPKGFTFWNGYLRRRKGARFGPSLMPGGNKEAYERLRPIFESIAKVDGNLV
jgi:6-phosphogluconate dehydrogenase